MKKILLSIFFITSVLFCSAQNNANIARNDIPVDSLLRFKIYGTDTIKTNIIDSAFKIMYFKSAVLKDRLHDFTGAIKD